MITVGDKLYEIQYGVLVFEGGKVIKEIKFDNEVKMMLWLANQVNQDAEQEKAKRKEA